MPIMVEYKHTSEYAFITSLGLKCHGSWYQPATVRNKGTRKFQLYAVSGVTDENREAIYESLQVHDPEVLSFWCPYEPEFDFIGFPVKG